MNRFSYKYYDFSYKSYKRFVYRNWECYAKS